MQQDDLTLPEIYQIHEAYIAARGKADAIRHWRRLRAQGVFRGRAHAGDVVRMPRQDLDDLFEGGRLTVDELASRMKDETPPFLFMEHRDA